MQQSPDSPWRQTELFRKFLTEVLESLGIDIVYFIFLIFVIFSIYTNIFKYFSIWQLIYFTMLIQPSLSNKEFCFFKKRLPKMAFLNAHMVRTLTCHNLIKIMFYKNIVLKNLKNLHDGIYGFINFHIFSVNFYVVICW